MAKVKGPFALTVRSSVVLSFRTTPVPVRPFTVPPMVFMVGPPPEPEPLPEPEPEPEPDFLKLQPTRNTDVNTRMAMKNGFIKGFISDRRLLCYLASGWL